MRSPFLFLLLYIGIGASAQKLPNKQEASVWAPANIKVDGKAREWNNHFQAYNHATDILYTMANDDKNLYLLIQAKDPDVINRIASGGITLTIKKKNGKKVSITYPIVDKKSLYFTLKRKNEDTSAKAADSLMVRNNKILEQKCKLIGTSGIPNVDTLISVYNDDNVKASGLFDSKKNYTLEMSISLKNLGLVETQTSTIDYQIRINGQNTLGAVTILSSSNPEAAAYAEKFFAQMNEHNDRQSASTDFSGEYILAKAL